MKKTIFEPRAAYIKELFAKCTTPEDRYQKIIDLGRSAPPFPADLKVPENLVPGCQSLLYLHAWREPDGGIYFRADSDALISKGLAVLLIKFYNGRAPEDVLKHPPTILDDLGIYSSLSPTRAGGVQSLYLKMKQTALKFIV